MNIKAATSALCLALLLAACGERPSTSSPSSSPDADQSYEAYGMVIDTTDREPELCLGGVEESYPPQCRGIPLESWDWNEVQDKEKAAGITWAMVHVTGTYDGETFTAQDVGPFEETGGSSDPIETPCPEPAGGWTAEDPERATLEDAQKVQGEVQKEEDYAGLWLDYYNVPPGELTEENIGDIILTVAFTGDPQAHEAEIREMWGGPLCLAQHSHTEKELVDIQREFPAEEFGLETLWSDINIPKGFVTVGVITVDEETLQRIDERYGPGIVKIVPALRPVD
jgi:hypothetical protein